MKPERPLETEKDLSACPVCEDDEEKPIVRIAMRCALLHCPTCGASVRVSLGLTDEQMRILWNEWARPAMGRGF